MFCRCPNGFGGGPNTQTCPVCLAFPGALPVPNRRAIEETIKLGLALDCTIADRAVFHRKNYFYPDLPKAYQISQYDEPLCANGQPDACRRRDGDVEVGIVRAHLEEDAAKNVHVAASGRIHGATATLVDFNRGGTPLARDRHRAGHPRRRRRRSASSSCCARRSSSSGSRTRSSRRARCASTSTCRCVRPAPTSCARAPS